MKSNTKEKHSIKVGQGIDPEEADRGDSERGALREALRDSEALYATILNTVVDGIVTVDESGIVSSTNAAVEKIFGYAPEELIGQNIKILMPSDEAEKHDGYVSAYLETGVRKIIGLGREVIGRKKDGTEFPLFLAIGEARVSGERIFTGILRDISERARAAELLRNAHDQLEQRVQQRTTQLAEANRALSEEIIERREAELKLYESLKEKEVLLREIHHRVKNNLQLISSLLRLHLKRTKEISSEALATEIDSRIRSMALLHELLYQSGNLGRIKFVSYIETLAQSLVRYYGMTRYVELVVSGDEFLIELEQCIPAGLLVNELVTNCMKHAFPGGRQGRIEIELRQFEGGEVGIVVRDDGIGLPKGVEFGKTDSLGLELVQNLAKQLHGEVSSSSDESTEFRITFQKKEIMR